MNTKIVVVTAKGKFEHEIDKPYISIGRSKDNDIVIDDLSVSRRHAILERDETGKFFLTDLNSSNGTFVNNVRISEKTPITTNDHILLGKTTLVIEVPEDFQGTVRVDASQLQEKLKQEEQGTVQGAIPTPPPVAQTPPPPQPQQVVTPPPVQALPQTQPIPPAPQPQQQSYQHSEPYRGNIEYGGILQRFLALLVDGIIVGISFSIISGIFSFIFFRILPVGLASWLSILINLVLFVGVFAYYAIGYGKYGTTIGKKLFKLYIVDQKKLTTPTMSQGIIRALVQFFLSGIFFIGYIMAFFNPEHKTLHDMLAKTYVIRK
ncbi:hypothetical protein TTHT_1514 [Thermotomaculum hydrothermale]|uniref:FHA domain-containing protein n=1 Tax=Thermotomaculum hydrothermale TaxID=981385 RepID=A0A7R6PFY5_9BACT|nr:hypothetical protein TTHT_1514 [Thermotomaculum hydrothermale]